MIQAVNGVFHDGTTIRASIQGYGPLTSIQNISFNATVESTKVRGVGQKVIGETPGIHDVDDGSLEITLAEYQSILATFGGDISALMNKRFDITVTMFLPDTGVYTYVLRSCRIKGLDHSFDTGSSDALMVSLTIGILGIDSSPAPVYENLNVPFAW